MSDGRETPSAIRRFLQGGVPAVITGRPTRNRAKKGAVAGFVGAAGVGVLQNYMGILPALAITVAVVFAVVALAAWSARERRKEPRERRRG